MANHRRPSPDVRRYCEDREFSPRVCEGGFDYLLDRWNGIVAAVEDGYRLSFDEYLNDMDVRRIIDELGTRASDDEWSAVEAALPALDARFRAATRPVDACIWGERNVVKYGYRPERDWWYYRVPVDLGRVGDRGRWQEPSASSSSQDITDSRISRHGSRSGDVGVIPQRRR